MKNKFLKKTLTLGLVVILIFSSFVFASAESSIKLTTVYGSTLADLVLPEGYTWDAEDPAKVSTGDAGDKSFPAKTVDDNGELVNVAVEVNVEPAFIGEIYASTDSSHYYTGNPVIPEIKAYFNGKELVENKDYTLTCSDNINVGTAKITVEGIGNFKGKTTFYFSIIKKDVEGVYLDYTEAELVAGKTVELTAEVVYEDSTFKGVTWSSSDESIATVDEQGVVTAVAEGVAVITVTTNDGNYTAECTVNVVVHDEESDHNYRYVSSTVPGCETEGSVKYKCTVCDHEKTETISANGHRFVECHESDYSGLHVLYCEDCDKTVNQQHTYSEWSSNGDATFFKNGTKTRNCVYCEYSETITEENSSFFLRIVSTVYETVNSGLAVIADILSFNWI